MASITNDSYSLTGWGSAFAASGRFPIVANTVFKNYSAILTYATSNATAYAGAIVSALEDEIKSGQTYPKGAYYIASWGEGAEVVPVGKDVDLSDYVTKDQISSVYTYKGSKDKYSELPTTGNTTGDVWNVNEAYSNHPAGTNWVWNGTAWDALAGSVDLSGYALTADVDASVAELAAGVAANLGAINGINSALTNKVDKVEGSSLIPSDKLTLIDTNAAGIQALENQNLNSRVSALEGMFKDGDNNIDLSGISASITDHTSRIVALEGDNTTNKANITALQSQIANHGGRLTAIETLNTEQSTQISGLTTRVENVEKHGEAITNLTTVVNGHTQDISDIKSSISGLAVKSVASTEKILDADANGVLSTTIKLGYDAKNKKIQLKGISDAIVDELDATVFVKDGMLSEASYDTATKEIVLTWNTDAGTKATRIPMASLVDTYTAGSGLKVESNEFAVKLDTNNNNKLTVSESGLLVDIISDIAALEDTMDDKIEAAFSWKNIEEL